MISALAALALAQAVPAAKPSFVFYCHLDGALDSDRNLALFTKRRPLVFLVREIGTATFAPVRTYDPSKLLGGGQVRFFRGYDEQHKSYLGFTGIPSENSTTLGLSIIPSDSMTHNEWVIAIGNPKKSAIAGKCLLMDGIDESGFEGLITSLGARVSSSGELK